MFRSVSGASLLLQRLNVQLDASCPLRNYRAMRCCRVYRRLSACKAAVLFRPCLFGLEHEIPSGSSSVHVVARARMAAFALNAPREHRDSTNELESFLSVRSPAAVMIQTRRSSTTPEKTRDERAAHVQSKIFLEVATDSLFCLCFSVRVSWSIIDYHHGIILLHVSVRWISPSSGSTSSA
ncbi:protein FAM210B, mitochondrial isoform X3 [Megalobrama amblycephala]|uniref:protein FAM210B, mitochondrial isoform X3 n=1 Tax=Megalobrama amblycephala TaxID=75352 RepID=UPI002014335E|nr:protein FAM210B, mitochondrial isoform X3 [Megalobrama amblycephala]